MPVLDFSPPSPSAPPQTSAGAAVKPSFMLAPQAKTWIRANVEDDPLIAHPVPQESETTAENMILLINNIEHYQKTDPEHGLIKEFVKVHAVLVEMLENGPAGWQDATTIIVPYVFVTRLPMSVVYQVQKMHADHEPLDETKFAASVPREPLNFLFQLVRRVDRDPQKFMFGFAYSIPDKKIVPMCSSFCGASKSMYSELDEASKFVVVNDMRKGVESEEERATKPDEKQQKRDATVIVAVLRADLESAKRFAERLKAGERGRLLITMQTRGVSSKFQPLDAELRAHLLTNTNPLDRTLEWISTCDIKANMVVTIQDNHSVTSPQRTYVMLQPWVRDLKWFEDQEDGEEDLKKKKEEGGKGGGGGKGGSSSGGGSSSSSSEGACSHGCACHH